MSVSICLVFSKGKQAMYFNTLCNVGPNEAYPSVPDVELDALVLQAKDFAITHGEH